MSVAGNTDKGTKSLRVRAITYFLPLQTTNREVWARGFRAAGRFLKQAIEEYTSEGYTVQTTRIATNPLAGICPRSELLQAALDLQALATAAGVSLLSIGAYDDPALLPVLVDIVSQTSDVSCTYALQPLNAPDARAAAQAVLQIPERTAAEGNFRFAVAANCPACIPFFPVAYAPKDARQPSFAIGTENTAILRAAFKAAAGDLTAAGPLLHEHLAAALKPIYSIAELLEDEWRVDFQGIDTSLAPGLDTPSMTGSYECLGLGRFGGPGTLAISELITGVLQRLPDALTGYCGLMLPVCEDTGLAELASSGALRIADLLQYSAVCGCGLDTIPIPGLQTGQAEANEELVNRLAALFLDVAAMAFRLKKPLSARLLPIPNGRPGQMTKFVNPHLVNCKIMELA